MRSQLKFSERIVKIWVCINVGLKEILGFFLGREASIKFWWTRKFEIRV